MNLQAHSSSYNRQPIPGFTALYILRTHCPIPAYARTSNKRCSFMMVGCPETKFGDGDGMDSRE
jgi:hypothetical protein